MARIWNNKGRVAWCFFLNERVDEEKIKEIVVYTLKKKKKLNERFMGCFLFSFSILLGEIKLNFEF